MHTISVDLELTDDLHINGDSSSWHTNSGRSTLRCVVRQELQLLAEALQACNHVWEVPLGWVCELVAHHHASCEVEEP